MAIDYYYDFKFGGKKLSDFNGVIVNDDGWTIKNGLSSEKITEKLPRVHGELFIDYSYNARTIEVPIFIDGDIDMDEFYAWILDGEQWLEFIGSNRKIKAILDNQIEINSYFENNFKGITTLTFICYDPFYYDTNDTVYVITKSGQTVKNKGNVTSYPFIEVVPSNSISQTIKFRVNNLLVILKSVTKTLYIDCAIEEIYKIELGEKVNCFNQFTTNDYYDFVSLPPNKDVLIELIEGDVSSIKINPMSRYI